jgi:AraC family transcriptional regulator of adaptative response/methylated-DNA-[protein]-cysteine methyltransferase
MESVVERALPPFAEMYAALITKDAAWVGLFVACVRTTGIFCLPTCRAKKPRPENVTFVATAAEALRAGFRPCRVCRPTDPAGDEPAWMSELVARVEARPEERLTDASLAALGLDPSTVRRWFQKRHGVTFQGWQRAWRVGAALGELQRGAPTVEARLAGGFESPSGFREAFERLFGVPPSEAKGVTRLVARTLATPLGPMIAAASERGLALLEFTDRRGLEAQVEVLRRRFAGARGTRAVVVPGANEHLDRIEGELARYFAGSLRAFAVDVELPGTPFQTAVWAALRTIPFGTTWSYGDLARAIGKPSAVRAVGRANGENRVALVVPCHRVIGADGSPTGYAGGVWRKLRLLELERGREHLGP